MAGIKTCIFRYDACLKARCRPIYVSLYHLAFNWPQMRLISPYFLSLTALQLMFYAVYRTHVIISPVIPLIQSAKRLRGFSQSAPELPTTTQLRLPLPAFACGRR